MSGVVILARNSASSGFFFFVKPCTSALDWFKQETDQLLRIGSCPYGADAEIRVPPVAVAGDDAAADAGHQAAAAVQSRSVGLCRGELERKPLVEARNYGPETAVRGGGVGPASPFSEPGDGRHCE